MKTEMIVEICEYILAYEAQRYRSNLFIKNIKWYHSKATLTRLEI